MRLAVVEALKADVGVTALVGRRVYDYVAAGRTFPYVRCTIVITTPWEASGGVRGSLQRIQVDCFTKGYSRNLTETINSAICRAMDERPLSLASGYSLYLSWLQSQILPDPGEQGMLHGVTEFESVAAE
ncbi:MAG TPA: DUF3168 domain-containing protein [Reyranella sp.]|nr:DUF3168 domain-containing protein [Reyranella sp.]